MDQHLVFQCFRPSNRSIIENPSDHTLLTLAAFDFKLNRVAVGGKDRDIALFDIEASKQVWKAMNLPPNPQSLLQPLVWPTATCFLDADSSIGSNVMAVGSAHHELRIYDIRNDSPQRRPISYLSGGIIEHRVTSLCQIDPYDLVVGDAAGFLQIDLRVLGKPKRDTKVSTKGRFVGPTGSVRMLVKHRSESRMAAVGLDRMLRIYDTSKRKQLYCMYLKQRLNCVLVGQDRCWTKDSDDEDFDTADGVEDYID